MRRREALTVVIIGAGVAGLSAGCFAQVNGYRSSIYEMHNLPGGVCTSWTRRGFTFDGAIHWLTGTRPGTAINRLLQEVGALRDKRLITHEVLRQIVIGERRFNVYTDASRLEAEVATPVTWVRYTGVWRGAYEGWLPTKEAMGAKMQKTIPGLSNFYLCGQWVEPGGGVPVSVISGRNVIKLICRQERRRFINHCTTT